jgi:membrane protein YdbS with pleckstrin-like domain
MIKKILEGFLGLGNNSKWIAIIVAVLVCAVVWEVFIIGNNGKWIAIIVAVLVCAVVWEVFIIMVRQLSRAVRGLDNDK